MKTAFLFCLALLVPSLAQAQPAIRATNGVVNASSELPDVARGSWFVIFGTGLGPATISVQNGSPYPAVLSGTSVTFTPASGGTPVSALMYYTLATQVAGMLPSSTPAGAYNVKVAYNGQTSAASPVNVVERNFGYATQASNGQGPAQATYGGYDLNRFTTSTLGQWSLRPAKAGDGMVLWGTGLGADPASDANGGTSGDQTAAAQAQVIVGGIAVTPAYAGRSSGSPGLDQINFTVPSGVTPSCFVSLQVKAGGRLSNLGSIAVAAAGQTTCSTSVLTQAQLLTLDQGGTLTVGGLQLSKSATTFTASVSENTDTAAGWFGKYTIDAVANSNLAMVQPGACFLIQRSGTTDQIGFGQPPPQTLDAGTRLTLNGPNASNMAIPRQSDNSYLATLYSTGLLGSGATGSPTLAAGTYTVTGSGGAGVGAFSAPVTLPGDFVWTNQNTIANPIPRAAPLTVTWTGGVGGLVVILGGALTRTSDTSLNSTYSAFGFNCTAPASAGSFTVPSNILQQLPAVSGDATTSSFGLLSLFAVPDRSTGQGTFTAPLTAGGTIDLGVLGYEVVFNKVTGFN
ncbi:MAG: hypothetical protein ABSC05_09420 [Candidatus Solibacter sp.]|jgi:uncharacterized protein (TIGR03437 family)